ncbi:hypothetical protein niasHT_014172 [Heterodera trifolii]|uniref:Uncharacterized protein n=1 Tax=Heterodera trifolii TaxID=157864 RepID=A0ABD2KXZ1_9BILA
MMRRIRSNFSALLSAQRLAKSPPILSSNTSAQAMGSSMLTSTTTTISSSSSMPNTTTEIGIERRTSAPKMVQKTPRFFFWTLSQSEKKKNANSVDSSPRTPDSSRSVSFEGAEAWPWIDDVVEEAECECFEE